jgi:2-desacetyl-2-hydroxyethyl bacteriochlorophyllide A dehydrogenase
MNQSNLPTEGPALLVTQLGEAELGSQPIEELQEGEILLEVSYSGVSVGTEMLAATGKVDIFGEPPFVAGYQAVGEVIATAPDVADQFSLGDRVACFKKGAHRRYLTASADLSHRIDGTADLRHAAAFVQASVGANALNHANVKAGESVLVIGQGLVGQTTALQARLRGAYVIGADISDARLAISSGHCVDRAINPSEGSLSELLSEDFAEGVDVVIESTGRASLVDEGMRCLSDRGRFVFEGYYASGLQIEYAVPHRKQIQAVFPWFIGPPAVRDAVLRSISSGILDLEPLITHSSRWDESAAMYMRLIEGDTEGINGVVIDWGNVTE